MSKFKVGDRVKVVQGTYTGEATRLGTVGVIDYIDPADKWPYSIDSDTSNYYGESELELIKGEQTMGRRTFRLLKETPELIKGALVQEQCDDGDQPYEAINDADKKEDTQQAIYRRGVIENQPKFFEEVFPLVPEYGNKAEVEAFKKFAKGRK